MPKPKNKWEKEISVSLEDIFGTVSKDEIIEDDIEEDTEDENGKEVTDEDDIELCLAEYGMELIDGFEEKYPDKKLVFRNKPTLSYFEYYLKYGNMEYLGNIEIDKFPKSFKRLFDKKMESISEEIENNSNEIEQDNDIDYKKMYEETLKKLQKKTKFAQDLIEMLDWLYKQMNDDKKFEVLGEFTKEDIEMIEKIEEKIE